MVSHALSKVACGIVDSLILWVHLEAFELTFYLSATILPLFSPPINDISLSEIGALEFMTQVNQLQIIPTIDRKLVINYGI